jgi:sulfide dehydrogenase cytochrome subunit
MGSARTNSTFSLMNALIHIKRALLSLLLKCPIVFDKMPWSHTNHDTNTQGGSMQAYKRLLKYLMSPLLAIGLSLPGIAIQAADGGKLAQEKCEQCHGKNGNSDKEDVPSIAGFSDVVLIDSMEKYSKGERTGAKYKIEGESETDMNEIAKKLGDEDIKALGVFYSTQKFLPRAQKFDAKLAEKGAEIHDSKCETCHADEGSNPDNDAAILAGQWTPYLRTQCSAFKSGEREAPKKMQNKMENLSAGDIEALLNFYASKQ